MLPPDGSYVVEDRRDRLELDDPGSAIHNRLMQSDSDHITAKLSGPFSLCVDIDTAKSVCVKLVEISLFRGILDPHLV
jgi:hypothetical protein